MTQWVDEIEPGLHDARTFTSGATMSAVTVIETPGRSASDPTSRSKGPRLWRAVAAATFLPFADTVRARATTDVTTVSAYVVVIGEESETLDVERGIIALRPPRITYRLAQTNRRLEHRRPFIRPSIDLADQG
jgi:hypothetical protein